jgi:hypothetical protein
MEAVASIWSYALKRIQREDASKQDKGAVLVVPLTFTTRDIKVCPFPLIRSGALQSKTSACDYNIGKFQNICL